MIDPSKEWKEIEYLDTSKVNLRDLQELNGWVEAFDDYIFYNLQEQARKGNKPESHALQNFQRIVDNDTRIEKELCERYGPLGVILSTVYRYTEKLAFVKGG